MLAKFCLFLALSLHTEAFIPKHGKPCGNPSKLFNSKVAIVGPKSGVGTAVFNALSEQKKSVVQIDGPIAGSIDAEVLILSEDDGSGYSVGNEERIDPVLPKLLPPQLKQIIFIASPKLEAKPDAAKPENESKKTFNPFEKFWKEPEVDLLTTVRALSKDLNIVIIHTGRLFGSSSGSEPVPFLNGPKAEPKLDESWTRRACLMSPGPILSQDKGASTKRKTLASAVAFLIGKGGGSSPKNMGSSEFSLISVEGDDPNENEWSEQFDRLGSASSGVSVLSLEFKTVKNMKGLIDWLVGSWGPQMLRRIESTMISRGARPVRVIRSEDTGAEVIWEAPTKDMEVKIEGRLKILVQETRLTVVRCDGDGNTTMIPLVGENEIIQNLLEGINTVAYNKEFVVKKPDIKRSDDVQSKASKEPKTSEKVSSDGKKRRRRSNR
mmetsp:Transcript_11032/g.16452  ORF Transcript_11032/g.16452 Transcript_11032/m.16452 type:complete len:437 (+) Transcript_11032:115-1425(+)